MKVQSNKSTEKKRNGGGFIAGIAPVIALVLFSYGPVFAHGTIGRVVEKTSVCVLFTYDDGLPMEYAKVSIKVADSELPHQTGGTDKNGIFCFVPDHEAQWLVVANDGMGHRQEVSVSVDTGNVSGNMDVVQENQVGGGNRIVKALCGIFGILGFAGLFSWHRSRNKAFRNERKEGM